MPNVPVIDLSVHCGRFSPLSLLHFALLHRRGSLDPLLGPALAAASGAPVRQRAPLYARVEDGLPGEGHQRLLLTPHIPART